MKTYINIIFTGGSGGNFFSRCLNLLDGFYVWADKTATPAEVIEMDIDKKFNLLSYDSVVDKTFVQRDWIKFEVDVTGFSNIIEHTKLPNNSKLVWIEHVEDYYSKEFHDLNLIAGIDDRVLQFYINPFNNIEYCVLNALYKNTPSGVDVVMLGKDLITDPIINLINFEKIIDNVDTFLEEFNRICQIIGHKLTDLEIQRVTELYCQWKLTALTPDKFEDFKQLINYPNNTVM
jgi:hypothetical protein